MTFLIEAIVDLGKGKMANMVYGEDAVDVDQARSNAIHTLSQFSYFEIIDVSKGNGMGMQIEATVDLGIDVPIWTTTTGIEWTEIGTMNFDGDIFADCPDFIDPLDN